MLVLTPLMGVVTQVGYLGLFQEGQRGNRGD